jgi:hypothetical protein
MMTNIVVRASFCVCVSTLLVCGHAQARQRTASATRSANATFGMEVADRIPPNKRRAQTRLSPDPKEATTQQRSAVSSSVRLRRVTASTPPVAAPLSVVTPLSAADGIKITSLAEDGKVIVEKVELKIELINPKISEIRISVKDKNGKEVGKARELQIKRGVDMVKTAVALAMGENTVTVSNISPGQAVEESAKILLTREKESEVNTAEELAKTDPEAAGDGTTGAAAAASETNKKLPLIFPVPQAGDDELRIEGEVGKKYRVSLNGEDVGDVSASGDGTMLKRVRALDLGDTINVARLDQNGAPENDFSKLVKVEQKYNLNQGGPVGLLLGGVVLSQQAQQFGQSDPFFGFIAGYSSYIRGESIKRYAEVVSGRVLRCGISERIIKKNGKQSDDRYKSYIEMDDHNLTDDESYVLVRDKVSGCPVMDGNTFKRETKPNRNKVNQFVKSDAYPLNRRPLFNFLGGDGWRWNARVQGIFNSNGRAAETTNGMGTGSGNQDGSDPFKFIASRKTFDVESHAWIDLYPKNIFSIGPYFGIGASTVLDKTELQNEPVTVDAANQGAMGTVATSSVSDNDIKYFFDLGLVTSLDLFDRNLFVQSVFAYGKYEALRGLDTDGDDTTKRFIGKLRVFPNGLNRRFGRQIKAAPMFGVDINAGTGPDHIKFFTGFAINIRGITP